jgi:hypothetical protein
MSGPLPGNVARPSGRRESNFFRGIRAIRG